MFLNEILIRDGNLKAVLKSAWSKSDHYSFTKILFCSEYFQGYVILGKLNYKSRVTNQFINYSVNI